MSLDGVIQSPARHDEDTRKGFSHGGWAVAGGDPVMTEWIGPISSGGAGGMLLGRRSYEGMLSHWNRAGGSFKDALNAAPKYVASSSPSTKPEWPNPTPRQREQQPPRQAASRRPGHLAGGARGAAGPREGAHP